MFIVLEETERDDRHPSRKRGFLCPESLQSAPVVLKKINEKFIYQATHICPVRKQLKDMILEDRQIFLIEEIDDGILIIAANAFDQIRIGKFTERRCGGGTEPAPLCES